MIPARMGSKRVPKKNLRKILGKQLIQYPIDAANEAGVFDEIYINSESDVFKDIAEKAVSNFTKGQSTYPQMLLPMTISHRSL